MSGAIASAIRRVLSNWRNPLLPPPTPGHLEAIRLHEIGSVIPLMPSHGRILEIGAGTGWQARALAQHGFKVDAIGLPTSQYAVSRVWPVRDYDGVSIPFPSSTFDVVFSASTLEHIPHLRAFQSEIRRVLRPGGVAIHILQSAAWRFWTSLTHPLRYLTFPIVHGEHASNVAVLGPAGLAELQLGKLNALLAHCWKHVPFLQRFWRDHGCRPGPLAQVGELAGYPVLTKSLITEHYEDMIALPWRGRTLTKTTGGSTGDPFRFEYTMDVYARRTAVMWRGYGWAGAGLGTRTAYLWGTGLRQGGWGGLKDRL